MGKPESQPNSPELTRNMLPEILFFTLLFRTEVLQLHIAHSYRAVKVEFEGPAVFDENVLFGKFSIIGNADFQPSKQDKAKYRQADFQGFGILSFHLGLKICIVSLQKAMSALHKENSNQVWGKEKRKN